ncbi:MAG: NADH-quinone oxidoreductase subunit J [Sulfurospirillum sp.]
MIDILFLILLLFALMGAIGMVIFSNTMHSALSFVVTVMALAGLYALLSASFLFMVQIIIYAGAIITLLLFIIMFLNIREDHAPKEPNKYINMLVVTIVLIPVDYLLFEAFLRMPHIGDFSTKIENFGDIKMLGDKLFRGWLLPFEAISILLLVALIGSIVLARKKERK